MSNTLVALLTGVGFGGWIYTQMMRRTNNPTTSVYVAVGAGLVMAFVIFTVFKYLFPAPDDGSGDNIPDAF